MSMTQAQTRRPFYRRRKTCPFTGGKAPKIDYKDVRLLQRYVSERGKIVPSRITAVSATQQCRAAADQCGCRQEATLAGTRHQARALSRSVALSDPVDEVRVNQGLE